MQQVVAANQKTTKTEEECYWIARSPQDFCPFDHMRIFLCNSLKLYYSICLFVYICHHFISIADETANQSIKKQQTD